MTRLLRSFFINSQKAILDFMAIESTIHQFFEPKNNIISVDLFGSYAQQRETEHSDVDIAILCDPENVPSPLELIEWREELETLIHKKVDLVCLNHASPILGMQVTKNRKNLLTYTKKIKCHLTQSKKFRVQPSRNTKHSAKRLKKNLDLLGKRCLSCKSRTDFSHQKEWHKLRFIKDKN